MVIEPGKGLAKELGKRIMRKRRSLGMTQLELANKVGATQSAISQIERNETAPGFMLLVKISDALNEPMDRLLMGDKVIDGAR